jgi:nuclear cap-binding protein subunit 1
MASPATNLDNLANSLLEKTDVIASTPHALESLVDPFPQFGTTGATSSESALSLLQKHMQHESKNEWPLICLPRPWRVPKLEGEEDLLSSAQKHPFPDVNLPATIISSSPVYPEIYFSVYADQDVSTTPPPTDPSAILIRDTLVDTIEALHFNRNEAARFLIDIDRYLGPGTFVDPKTPFDKVREVAGDRAMWKPEDVIVDACFAMLFTLPHAEHRLVYYHSVLTEACKLEPQAVAPSLGRAIRFLYHNVERMDVELFHRFLDWFAHHLSNFGFTWKWTEWVDDVNLPNVHAKKAFMLEALDKEMRLSFAQRIKGTLPAEVAELITSDREKDVPESKFAPDDAQYSEEGREIAKLIRQKAGKEEMLEVLNKIGERFDKIDVLVTTMCQVGSKSLSHFLNVVERTKDVVAELVGSSEDQAQQQEKLVAERQIVRSVLEFWKTQPGNGVMVVDKLLNYLLVSPESVVGLILDDWEGVTQQGFVLAKGWAWELVEKTLGKVVGRVKGVVAAYRKPGLEDERRAEIMVVVDQEVAKMKKLVEDILSQLNTIAEAVSAAQSLGEQEKALVVEWCAKWRSAVVRRGEVESQWVKEELGKPIPPPPPTPAEPEPELKEDGSGKRQKMDRDGDVGMDTAVNGSGEKGDERGGENGVKAERGEEMLDIS